MPIEFKGKAVVIKSKVIPNSAYLCISDGPDIGHSTSPVLKQGTLNDLQPYADALNKWAGK